MAKCREKASGCLPTSPRRCTISTHRGQQSFRNLRFTRPHASELLEQLAALCRSPDGEEDVRQGRRRKEHSMRSTILKGIAAAGLIGALAVAAATPSQAAQGRNAAFAAGVAAGAVGGALLGGGGGYYGGPGYYG